MATYAELKAQADALMAQAELARKSELAAVISDIKAKIKEFGLTASDLGLGPAGASAAKKTKSASKLPAKYRGPNGELWAGGPGRKPEWVRAVLAAGKSIEDYRI